nr:hypothetical protein [Arthrobacter sp. CAL618]
MWTVGCPDGLQVEFFDGIAEGIAEGTAQQAAMNTVGISRGNRHLNSLVSGMVLLPRPPASPAHSGHPATSGTLDGFA